MGHIKKIVYDYKKFGIKGVIYHILIHLHILDSNKLNEIRALYFEKQDRSDYEKELKEWYEMMGGTDNLDNPQTFNGKIQWLKIHDASPLKTKLADKFLVRDWIKEKIGEEYLVELLGVYDSYDQIDFNILPSQFVIKANHGSGMIIIVKDKSKLDMKYVQKETTRWMNTTYGYEGMEIHYLDIPKKILIEKYIEEMDGNLFDYKIHCFNGEPKYIHLIGNRDLSHHTAKEVFYDLEWHRMPFHYAFPMYKYEIEKPQNLDQMISIANILCKDFKYVRVDLYSINNKIKFGEMTFTPADGMCNWQPDTANFELGALINLNDFNCSDKNNEGLK